MKVYPRLIPCLLLLSLLAGCTTATTQPTAIPTATLLPTPNPSETPVPAPSATETQPAATSAQVLPETTPLGFEFLYGLGSRFMLPPEFPAVEGLPAVVPMVLSVDGENYDISLDYGAECQGAGACHYGSLSGKKITGDQPESTANFVYDAEGAQQVSLSNGIEGFFIEGQCGASCDDSRLFWIYDGFQFMLGLKGGEQQALVDLANAAIENSIH
jgi:hypothetical protein